MSEERISLRLLREDAEQVARQSWKGDYGECVSPEDVLALVEVVEAAHEWRLTLGLLTNLEDTENGRALLRLLDALNRFDFDSP